VCEDEASFQQSPGLRRTWARRHAQPQIPSLGRRNTQKVCGAVSLPHGRLAWRRQEPYFNFQTHVAFLEEVVLPTFYRSGRRVYLIEDNASYHLKPEALAWEASEGGRLKVFRLPKYSPQFNPMERVWGYTRREGTHNRYFATVQDLLNTLEDVLEGVRRHPQWIKGLLEPFWPSQEC
jgi:transposase